MIFLLNVERVLLEGIELARLRISKESGIGLAQIEARLDIQDGRVVPTFKLAGEIAGALEQVYTEQLMRDVWRGVQVELIERLRGLLEVRYGCSQPQKSEKDKTDSSRA